MTDEKDPRREVNPARRDDPPRRLRPREEREGEREEGVGPTQGTPLDPRRPGGIPE